MDMATAAKAAVQVVLASKPNLSVNKSKCLCFNGRILLPPNSAANIFEALEKRVPGSQKAIAISLGSNASWIYDETFQEVFIKEAVAALYTAVEADADNLYLSDSIKAPLSKIKILLNVKNRQQSLVYDSVNDKTYPYEYVVVMDILARLLGDNMGQWLANNTELVTMTYIPQQPRLTLDSQGHKAANFWSGARWAEAWVPDPESVKLHPEIKAFLEVLFPEEPERAAIYRWLRDCCFGRAEPILVLCGCAGAGKNIFVEHLCSALVGMENYRQPSRRFGTSGFHSSILNCRVFYLDEMNLNATIRDTLKAYHNGMSAIERKGVDVADPEKIHASIVIANNFKHNIQLEYTDRKFFAPKISDKNLTDVWEDDRITTFKKVTLKDDKVIAEFANYLYHTYPAGGSVNFPKGEFFNELCINSYPQWFIRFIKIMHGYAIYNSKQFNKRQRPIEPLDLQRLIEHYETTFKKSLATLEIKPDSDWIAESKIVAAAKLAVGKEDMAVDTDDINI